MMDLYHRGYNRDYNWWETTGWWFDLIEGPQSFKLNPELRVATMLEF